MRRGVRAALTRQAVRTPRRSSEPECPAARAFNDLRRRRHWLGDGGNDAYAETSPLQATSHFWGPQQPLTARQLAGATPGGRVCPAGRARSGISGGAGERAAAPTVPRRCWRWRAVVRRARPGPRTPSSGAKLAGVSGASGNSEQGSPQRDARGTVARRAAWSATAARASHVAARTATSSMSC